MAKISYHNFFFKYHHFTIICHVDLTIVSDQFESSAQLYSLYFFSLCIGNHFYI